MPSQCGCGDGLCADCPGPRPDRGVGRLNGCGRLIKDGRCGEVGLCVTCWAQVHDEHLTTVKSERDDARNEYRDLHKAVGDLIAAYMNNDDLGPPIAALEDLTGGQQHAS